LTIRLFYELRALFAVLMQTNPQSNPGFFSLAQGEPFHGPSYPGVADPLELFNNATGRPITVEIEALGAKPTAPSATRDCVTKIVLKAEPLSPLRWTMEAYGTRQGAKIHSPQGYQLAGPHVAASPDGRIQIEVNDMAEILETFAYSRYYGAFRNAINVGAGDHYDLRVGTAFIDLWNAWNDIWDQGTNARNRTGDRRHSAPL
jgi:hypothetical protein